MTYSCPNNCNPDHFIQTIEQTEIVHVDDDGEPEQFEPVGDTEAKEVQCGDCETNIHEEEE